MFAMTRYGQVLRRRAFDPAVLFHALALGCVLASAALWQGGVQRHALNLFELYSAICGSLPATFANTSATPGEAARPKSIVSVVSQEDIGDGKILTVQRVQYPPRGFTPKHVHGGVVQGYITKGVLLTHISGQQPGEFAVGSTFHETYGAIYFYVENPSATEWAELLAIQVHRKDEALTTFVD